MRSNSETSPVQMIRSMGRRGAKEEDPRRATWSPNTRAQRPKKLATSLRMPTWCKLRRVRCSAWLGGRHNVLLLRSRTLLTGLNCLMAEFLRPTCQVDYEPHVARPLVFRKCLLPARNLGTPAPQAFRRCTTL